MESTNSELNAACAGVTTTSAHLSRKLSDRIAAWNKDVMVKCMQVPQDHCYDFSMMLAVKHEVTKFNSIATDVMVEPFPYLRSDVKRTKEVFGFIPQMPTLSSSVADELVAAFEVELGGEDNDAFQHVEPSEKDTVVESTLAELQQGKGHL